MSDNRGLDVPAKRFSMFYVRRNRFENKTHTVESLLKERQELYERLQLSRDELDSYIRHMQRISDEKNDLAQELTEKNMSFDMLNLQNQRLENQNKILVNECNDLMNLLCKFGPKEMYSYENISSDEQKEIFSKIKDSVTVICNDNSKLHVDHVSLKKELEIVKKALEESNKEMSLTKKALTSLQNQIMATNMKDTISYDQNMLEGNSRLIPSNVASDVGRNDDDANSNQRYLSINYSDSNFQNDGLINFHRKDHRYSKESYVKNLKKDDYYVDNTGNRQNICSSVNENDSHYEDNELMKDSNTTIPQKDSETPNDTDDYSDVNLKSQAASSTLTQAFVWENYEAIAEVGRMVHSFLALAISSENQDCGVKNTESLDLINENRLSRHVLDVTSPNMFIDECKIIKEGLTLLINKFKSVFSQDTNLKEENTMLKKELESMKYALTSRMELRAHRMKDRLNECNCKENKKEFDKKIIEYELVIKELNDKVAELEDEKSNLFMLMGKIMNTEE